MAPGDLASGPAHHCFSIVLVEASHKSRPDLSIGNTVSSSQREELQSHIVKGCGYRQGNWAIFTNSVPQWANGHIP